jgi:transcriptional regulator GlxA family with amidase domain
MRSDSPQKRAEIAARNVAILIFDDIEVLDFAGPFEVFSVAAATMPRSPYPAFFPYTVGVASGPVTARGGLVIAPRYTFDDCPSPDVLIVPGGEGSRRLLKHDRLLAWLAHQAQRAEITASVCTGALVLAHAGVLAGKRVTTHHGAFDRLPELDPTVEVVRDVRYVKDGKVWTSGGISAGLDMSLAMVKQLLGDHEPVVEEMEWGWHPS